MSLADQVTLGKPKGLGKDHWDRRLDYRDREVLRHPDKYGSSWQVPMRPPPPQTPHTHTHKCTAYHLLFGPSKTVNLCMALCPCSYDRKSPTHKTVRISSYLSSKW